GSPQLAARFAEHLFLSPGRYRRPAWERMALRQATPFVVPYGGMNLPAWVWGAPLGRTDIPTVLLVHGWEGRGSQLAKFVSPLVERGFRVVTFDGPAHGDAPGIESSFVDLARALMAIGRVIGPSHGLIGHSVGGAAAILATQLGFEA